MAVLSFVGLSAQVEFSWSANTDWTADGDDLTLTQGSYTVLAEKASAGTKPLVHTTANDLRVYAKGQLTITAATGIYFSEVVFKISAQGKKRLTTLTPNAGEMTYDVENGTVTWSGKATSSVTFDVGEKATYGTDGDSKAGQFDVDTPILITESSEVPPAVAAPVITPKTGTFYEPQEVSITAEEGAEIFYSLNKAGEQKYEAPFTVSETTVIEAYAKKGEDVSTTTKETLTFGVSIANLAAANEAATNDKVSVRVNFTDALVLYVNGQNTYIQDATGALLIYGTSGLTAGDKVTGYVDGQLYLYNGLPEVANPTVSAETVSTGNRVAPVEIDAAELAANPLKYVSQYVKVRGAKFAEDQTVSTKVNINFTVGETALVLRNNFVVEFNVEAAKEYQVAGLVTIYKEAVQLYPTKSSDIHSTIYIETDLTNSFTALTQASKWTTGAGGPAGYTATNFCPMVTTNAGQTVQVCEFYESNCNRTGDMLYQTVTGLAAGIYRIELYGAAAYTFGRGFTSTAFSEGTWNAGDKIEENTGVTLYAETSEGNYGGEIPIYYATDFPDGAATVVLDGVVIGEDGKVKIGMSKTSTSTNWHVIQLKGVTAKMPATDALAMAVAQAQAVNAENVPTTVYNELNAVVEANNVEFDTEEEYIAAINAINAAVSKANAYATANDYFTMMKAVLDETNFYTEEAYNAVYGEWATAFEAGTLDESILSTLNADRAYSTGWHTANNIDDVLLSVWTIDDVQCKDYDAGMYINTWSVEGNTDGTEFRVPFFEYWTADANSLEAKTLTATLNGLEPGKVADVSIWVRARAKNGVTAADATGITLQVNNGTAVDVTEGEGVGQFNLAQYKAHGLIGEDGKLTVKIVVAADNNISWLSYKNAMYELKDETEVAYEDAIATLKDGQTYRIFTEVGENKFYLNTSGVLVAEAKKAATFTFTAVNVEGTLYPTGWNLGCRFTNPTLTNSSTGDIVQKGQINVGGNDRNDWERQVFFLNGDGKYAVRATNSNNTTWGANTYWTVTNTEAELPNADYQLEPAYVWQVEENVDNRPEAFAKIQSWAKKLQDVTGLVQDVTKYTSNAKESKEGSYAALLDGDYTTFFHSSWSSGADADHYLQAEIDEPVSDIYVYFKKRSQNNNNRPTNIQIAGSQDGVEFTDIMALTEGLPTEATPLDYTSAKIALGEAYKYVRFTVLETNNNATEANGHKFFTFSEFYLLPSNEVVDAAVPFLSVGDYTDLEDTDIETINTLDEQIAALVAVKTLENDIAALKAEVDKLQAKIDATDTYTDEANIAADATSTLAGIKNSTYTTAEAIAEAQAQVMAIAKMFFASIKPLKDIDITDYFIVNATPVNNIYGWEGDAMGNKSNGVAEYWNQSGASFHQTVELPAGDFRLNVVALQRTDMTGYVYAGDNSVEIVTVGSDVVNSRPQAAAWFDEGNGVNTIDFTLYETGSVEIGLKADESTGDHWTVWRNFQLIMTATEIDPNDYTSYIVNADLKGNDGWDATNTKGLDGSGIVKVSTGTTFDFKQTINLPAGQYKMTAQAAYRYTGSEADEYAAIQAGDKTKYATLYATTAQETVSTEVQNRYDGASDTDFAAGNGSVEVNGKFVPNSSNAVKAWFEAGQYVNEVTFNLPADGDVTIGIAKSEAPEAGDYTVLGPWTLTRIGDAIVVAINDVEAVETGKAAIYDLTGRRVEKAVKGIYIINGKKVLK